MSNTHSEVAAFAEGLGKIPKGPAATAEFLAQQLAPDLRKWGLSDGAAALSGLNLASAIRAVAQMRPSAESVLAEFSAKDAARDDHAAEVAFLRFRRAGNVDADGLADAQEGRLLLALLEAASRRRENGWAMLDLTARHLEGKEAVVRQAAADEAALKADVSAGKETAEGPDYVRAAQERVDALREKAEKAAPGSDEAKRAQDELAEATAALKGLTDKKAFARAVDASTDLDKDVRSNQVLEGLFKFLREILAKAGLKDVEFLRGQLERVEGKLASHEWGAEMPAGFEKRARSERGFKDSREYLYAKKQAEKIVESRQKLQDCADLIAPASTPAELEALKPAFDRKVRETGFRYPQNLARFQEAYAERLAAVSKAAPAAAQESPERSQSRAQECVRAFSRLPDGADLNGAGTDAAGAPFFSFDASAAPSVSADGRKTQVVRFLGTAVAIDVNTRDDVKLLASVTRAKGGNPELDGVRFNEGYLSMTDFKKGLVTLFSTGSAHFDFQGLKVTATPVPPAPAAPAGEGPSVPLPGSPAPTDGAPSASQGVPAAPAPVRESFDNARDAERLVVHEGYRVVQSIDFGSVDAFVSPEKAKELSADLRAVKRFQMVYGVWRDQAQRVVDGLYWKDSRNDDEIVLAKVKAVDEKFGALLGRLASGAMPAGEARAQVDACFALMLEAEAEEDIVGPSDLSAVRAMVKGDFVPGEQAEMLNKLRYRGWSGNSEGVKSFLLKDMSGPQGDFPDVGAALGNPDTLEAVRANNVEGVRNSTKPAMSAETAQAVVDAYNKMQARWAKSQPEYVARIRAANPGASDTEINAKFNEVKELSMALATEEVFANAVIYERVAGMGNRAAGSGELNVYADLVGLANNKGVGDAFRFSDENMDALIDVTGTLALAVVTMGVGALFARGAMLAVQFGARATRAAALAERLAATGRIGRWGVASARTVGSVALEGVVFYQFSNFAHNAVVGGPGHFTDNWSDGKENLKSIVFMGVLKGFSALASKWAARSAAAEKGAVQAVDLAAKVSPSMLRQAPGILLQAGVITGASLGIDVYCDDREWADASVGEYLQALALVAIMRQSPKIDAAIKAGAARLRVGRKGVQVMEPAVPVSAAPSSVPNPQPRTAAAEVAAPSAKAIESVRVSASEITINGTRKSLPASGEKPRLYTAENVRISGNPDGTYLVTRADGAAIPNGGSVPRAELRDFLLGRAAEPAVPVSVAAAEVPNPSPRGRAEHDAAVNAKFERARADSSRASAENLIRYRETLRGRRAEARLAELRSTPPQDVVQAIRTGESVRFGTLAQGAGDYVTVRRVDGKTCEIVEVRGGVAQPARTVENLRFEGETGGKVYARMVGDEVVASGRAPYEYANVREIF